MKIIKTNIPDVKVIEPDIYQDERGFFMETWQYRQFGGFGIDYDFVQDNQSHSKKNTLRGLHYQMAPHVQGKLVRVVQGEVYDVAIDIRRSSSTFKQWVGEHLSAENRRMLWVPPGFAHGFLVLSDFADLLYKCTDYYSPEHECCIRWDDPDLSIKWPLENNCTPLLSPKDGRGDSLSSAYIFS